MYSPIAILLVWISSRDTSNVASRENSYLFPSDAIIAINIVIGINNLVLYPISPP